jgi:hypothetical protein
LDVVTGAFGYTGKWITRRLVEMGRSVQRWDKQASVAVVPEAVRRRLNVSVGIFLA